MILFKSSFKTDPKILKTVIQKKFYIVMMEGQYKIKFLHTRVSYCEWKIEEWSVQYMNKFKIYQSGNISYKQIYIKLIMGLTSQKIFVLNLHTTKNFVIFWALVKVLFSFDIINDPVILDKHSHKKVLLLYIGPFREFDGLSINNKKIDVLNFSINVSNANNPYYKFLNLMHLVVEKSCH